MPTPPATTNAPVSVEFAAVVLYVDIISSVTKNVVVTVVSCISNSWAIILPPTYKSPPIPTPPLTINPPVLVEVEFVLFVIDMTLSVVAPRSVTLCNVLVFQIVIVPVLLLTAVSVPAVIV